MGNIQAWYLEVREQGDLVISASPEFLLEAPCKRLGILPPIASKVDAKTGNYTGVNCHGKEKVRRFREQFGQASVENFYSDSKSDSPMAELAVRAFFIRKGQVLPWPW